MQAVSHVRQVVVIHLLIIISLLLPRERNSPGTAAQVAQESSNWWKTPDQGGECHEAQESAAGNRRNIDVGHCAAQHLVCLGCVV